MKRDYDWWLKNKLTTRQFNKLDSAAKRVYIARDVLAQLQVGSVVAKNMLYLTTPAFKKELTERQLGGDLGTLLSKSKCEACAIGAMFTCAVVAADRAPVASFLQNRAGNAINTVKDGEMRQYLDRFFSREQQAMIEAAFEGQDIADNLSMAGVDRVVIRIAEQYNLGIKDSRTRMTRIMRNIIRNGGDFDPKDTTLAAR